MVSIGNGMFGMRTEEQIGLVTSRRFPTPREKKKNDRSTVACKSYPRRGIQLLCVRTGVQRGYFRKKLFIPKRNQVCKLILISSVQRTLYMGCIFGDICITPFVKAYNPADAYTQYSNTHISPFGTGP